MRLSHFGVKVMLSVHHVPQLGRVRPRLSPTTIVSERCICTLLLCDSFALLKVHQLPRWRGKGRLKLSLTIMTLSHSEKSSDLTSEKAESSPRKFNSPTCSQTSSSYRLNGHKEKRQPTITPRKFTRFFTPRSHGPIASSSRRALEDITAPVNNRNGVQSSPIRSAKPIAGQDNSPTIFTRDLKRRKLLHTPSPSPENSSPAKAHSIYQPQVSDDEDPKDRRRDFSSPYWKNVEDGVREHHSPSLKPTNASLRHIRQLDTQGISGQLLQLNIGSRSTHSRRRSMWPVSG
jgi:hypothetical protein